LAHYFNVGKNEKNIQTKKENVSAHYADYEKVIANKGYWLEFFHIPTGKSVQFKAMLTSFSDAYTSEWNDETFYGRMDPMDVFKRTGRVISVAWNVVAGSEEEAKDNLSKVSLLASMLYPVYNNARENDATSMSASPLFKLSFANLIKSVNSKGSSASPNAQTTGLVGRMSGLTVTPNLDSGLFDGEKGMLYPQEFNLSFEFTIFHTHRVGWIEKNFAVGNFPYGVPHFSLGEDKKINEDSKANKTPNQKQAAINTITKGKKK